MPTVSPFPALLTKRTVAIFSVLTLLAIGMLLVGGMQPAHAHQVCSTLHPDGSYVCLGSQHEVLVVCDQHADGHYAYARTYRYGVVQSPLWDYDGAGGTCGRYNADVGSLDSFNICVEHEGCGEPRYWWEF